MKRFIFISAFFCALFASNQSFSFNAIKNNASTTVNRLCPAPIVSVFSPSTGPENTLITITGVNFTDVVSVQLEGMDIGFIIINDNEITAVAPATLSASSQINLISSGGCIGVSANAFTVTESECSTSSGEIYISEVYDSDGGSYGVIELYNPTNNIITLDGVYQIDRYGDIGNATPSYSILLTGTINPFDTFIIEMGSTGNVCPGIVPDLSLGAGINANDEIVLLKNGIQIDVLYTDVNIGYTYVRNPDAVVPSSTFDINDWAFSDNEICSNLNTHTEDPFILPNITQPVSQNVCVNGNTMFTVSVDTGTYTYQWKVLDASGNWIDIINNANYSGATTATLMLNNIPGNFDGNQYYCEMTSGNCDLLSVAVQLVVNNPEVDTLADQTFCTQYILPPLTNGNYFLAPNGGGAILFAGDGVGITRTIYIYNETGVAPDICYNESSFLVTITGIPAVDTIPDQNICSEYTLPPLTNGNYFSLTGGNGTAFNAGDVINTTQTIFIYNENGVTTDTCTNESSFTITILPLPLVDTIADQDVCTDFTLPALTNGNYFSLTGGNGTTFNAGDVISSDQTIFIYNETGTAPDICTNETSFTVTVVGTPLVDTIANQNVCVDYTLPTLTNGNYFSLTGGNGTAFNAGDVINATQTIFIYNQIGTAPDICTNETSFTITILGLPLVDTIANQIVCTDYTLPALTNGTYFSLTGGNGTTFNAGDVINSTQTIFIYNETGTAPDICTNETSFTVTVVGTPLVDTIANQNVCVDYTLPTLTNGNYFSLTGGNGTAFNAGDVINTTQTIFIYNQIGTAPDICTNETSFTITILGLPLVDTIANQIVCTDYTLPALTNGTYFSLTGGNGTTFNAGDVISSDQTIFIYNETGTAPDICTNEASFTVTIIGTPLVDTIANQNVCVDYTLPTLTNGNYFSLTGGNGTTFNAGDVINTTQTIFIYNQIGTATDICTNETSFTITILGLPLVDTISNQIVCTDYTLPALTNGNYFSLTGGNGTTFNAGDVISSDQTIFIYNETGTAPDICTNETSFTVTIIGTPLVDTIANQNVCVDYTLPTLTNGNYFSLTGGNGTTFNAGDVINATQTIFIYNQIGTAPDICTNETSFTITILGLPLVDTIANQIVCTDYTLPVLTNGTYFSLTGGNGTTFNTGDVISSDQTIFIYNETGTAPDICTNETSFTVTVVGTPLVDTIANQNVCVDYTLPTLTNGNYFSLTGGNGTTFNAGDVINTTQTIFIYNQIGTTPDICTNETSFTITILGLPLVDTIANQIVCTDYTLPALTNGTYFSLTGGNGTTFNAGDVISSDQTIFIYNETGTAPDICTNETSFTVTIIGTPLVDTIANQNVCVDYTLPTLTNGNYFSLTGGNGTTFNAGDVINTTQTIFIYNQIGTAPDICTNETSFTVTIIGTPLVDTIANQNVCIDYTLPTLTNGNYFSLTGGNGTTFNAGDVINATQTIFIYNQIGTAPDICTNETSFTITILGLPLVDTIANQIVCTDYTLPVLTNGTYFSLTGGNGTTFNAGDVISSDQTIFIYNETGTAPDICTNETSFTVTIISSSDFSLTESNIETLNETLTVNMNDPSVTYEYSLNGLDFQTSNVFSNLPEGTYILYVREIGGCITKSIFFEITIDLFIPKFLTPNEDGFKDTWKIIDRNNIIKDVYIFDRYGKLLKHIIGNAVAWNGTYNGKALGTNDYWYIINLRTGKQIKGHFTLKR
ncbi:T9SS type B sorting domain-containing protein [Psychroserpens ponticola]|uniref:T9SS type B sorting domain-containing protein n=1 Tax=Psychroserpens ponticola TaxID=2932268 RepID=A0ABY7S029_9FLAO|nr:T9SS type B sorting domain-containing protein [Psychroserpens ponticola]WCO02744.1 T9SS type B sorting domain-containing protein [Psychroserpens ponticola]